MRGHKAEETVQVLSGILFIPVKAPAALHSLPHWLSLREVAPPGTQGSEKFTGLFKIKECRAWIQMQVQLTPELVPCPPALVL